MGIGLLVAGLTGVFAGALLMDGRDSPARTTEVPHSRTDPARPTRLPVITADYVSPSTRNGFRGMLRRLAERARAVLGTFTRWVSEHSKELVVLVLPKVKPHLAKLGLVGILGEVTLTVYAT